MWLHRKSESRSPTEVECYWNKPILSTVGTTKKFIIVAELCKEGTSSSFTNNLPDNSEFFNSIITKAEEKQIDSQLSRHNFTLAERELYSLSLYQLIIQFFQSKRFSVNDFLEFVTTQLKEELYTKAEIETREQNNNLLWHELRFGRITASILHEAAHCQTNDGSFIQKLLGAAKKFDSVQMKRGRRLESNVLSEVEKKLKRKFFKYGFILVPDFPIFGASPNAVRDDFVMEVKYPNSTKTFAHYIKDGHITDKYKAQIHLQMFLTNKKKGLFCSRFRF